MQREPNEPPHQLLCWQNWGKEDITSYGRDKKRAAGQGGARACLCFEARKQELEGRLLEHGKDSGSSWMSLAALRRSPGWACLPAKGRRKQGCSHQHYGLPTTTRRRASQCFL